MQQTINQPVPGHDPTATELLALFQEHFVVAGARLREEQVLPDLEAELLNPALGYESRADRQLAGWRLFLQLTPWMLCRVLVPESPEAMALFDHPEQALLPTLGPRVSVTILGQTQDAHVQFDRQLGVFGVQPLVVGLASYRSAEEVFTAWSGVIHQREEMRRQRAMDCRWQQELSRREIFSAFRGAASG
ncbi:MAG: [NiFe]-hydrogenase assembly chaperone HybE [Magnetococcales bacterium]|nr:[NiFe]-hydrogenase assembly chaperone HybE [Magnetococcales bacterium]